MASIKTKKLGGKLLITVRLPFGECIDEKELNQFSRNGSRTFYQPVSVKKHAVEYCGPIGISLRQRLERQITDYEFFFIIEQIVETTRALCRNRIPWDRVLWSTDSVFFHDTTKELRFLYLPRKGVQKEPDILELIDEIIYSAQPADHNSHRLSDFAYFLHSLKGYDDQKIESFIAESDQAIVDIIRKTSTEQGRMPTDRLPARGEPYPQNAAPVEGSPALPENGNDDDGTVGLLPEDDYDKTIGLLDGEEEYEKTVGWMDGCDGGAFGLFGGEDDAATGLHMDEPPIWMHSEIRHPSILRVRTNETVMIPKSPFRLGKEQGFVDYCVSDNTAVSRNHADIITRGNRYFIVDLNSTNSTYVNERSILSGVETEIFDGDRIMLGNEQFVFQR